MEKRLSNTESLVIIEQMITRAKQEEKDSGWGWIIWGWLLFIASITHYVMSTLGIKGGIRVWLIFGIAGILLLIYSNVRNRFSAVKTVTTYTTELVNRIGDAFFISLMVMVLGNAVSGLNESGVNFGYLLLLYAFWMYIHGAAYLFRPMKIGAFINWAGAVVIFIWHVELGRNILLVHGLAVLLGYIVPGYMAQRNFRLKQSSEKQDHHG